GIEGGRQGLPRKAQGRLPFQAVSGPARPHASPAEGCRSFSTAISADRKAAEPRGEMRDADDHVAKDHVAKDHDADDHDAGEREAERAGGGSMMRTARITCHRLPAVLALIAAVAVALSVPGARAEPRAICYNCPPEWADWGSQLKAIHDQLGITVPADNK